jgi:UDP-glucuronate 4-epimerase
MKILVTGAAGFIGYHVSRRLLDKGHIVVGLDSINDYYDVNLKLARLEELGIQLSLKENHQRKLKSSTFDKFSFVKLQLEDGNALTALFKDEQFDMVCHLAAQAGVRYSLENPDAYVQSNIVGFLNILENCRHNRIQHLVYASSSSVYGANAKIPFETTDNVDHPVSLYAATKKSNELMAHAYSHLFHFPTTGLRFFTVYGPWGRPDMALFLFTKAIINGEPVNVFNNGELERDFTYIDDITEGVVKIIEKDTAQRKLENQLFKVYNSKSVKLFDFIHAIEAALGKKGKLNMMEMQPGDVLRTWANVDDLIRDYDYRPETPIEQGVQKFVDWYTKFYKTEDKINQEQEELVRGNL